MSLPRLSGRAVLTACLLLAATLQAAPTRDASATAVHLVRTTPGSAATVAAALDRVGVTARGMPALDMVSARLTRADAARLARRIDVLGLSPDRPLQLAGAASAPVPAAYDPAKDPYSLLRSGAVTGARRAWHATQAGAGVDVALIDSGVAAVPGLDGPGRLRPGVNLSVDTAAAVGTSDTFGHGTHMAGIIAGRDPGPDPAVDAGDRQRFLGMAPGAGIVPVKVADSFGTTDVSQVIAALDWVVTNARTGGRNIRVVNLSFGSDSRQAYQLDPLAFAAERAWHAGLVVVVSAGNGGRAGLGDPAYDPYVLAVGAGDTAGSVKVDDDSVPGFSNRADAWRGPDLIAPGVHQQSLRAPGSRIDRAYGDTGRLADRFFRGNGTSQAAAAVSGAAALLLAQRPELTPDQVKYLLRSTARPLPGVPTANQGRGLLDVAAASAAPTPDPAVAGQRWPRAFGGGSLDLARGTAGRMLGAVSGEVGDYGSERLAQTSDPVAMAAGVAAAAGALDPAQPTRALPEGRFAGMVWNGTTWDGTTWDGTTWDGTTWDGTTWDGTTWDGTTWDGTTWDGTTWDGTTWDGTTWDSAQWQ